MYTVTDYKTKKALKEAVASGDVPVFQPGGIGQVTDGENVVEGPHYPKPHTFYATVTVKNGVIPKGSRVR